MDIEGQLRSARDAGRAADKKASEETERLRLQSEVAVRLLRQAFGEFTAALTRNEVPQWKLVLLASTWIPAQRGMFRSTPGRSEMSAIVLGYCWPLGTTLLLPDGTILDATGVRVGSKIVPYDSILPSVRTNFLELSRDALRKADLGEELSEDCLYIMKAKTGEQLQPFDWSSAEGTAHYEGILFSVHGDQYVVKAGEVSVRHNTWDGYVEIPMDKAIANYISNAERYGRGAHGLTYP